MKNTRILNTPWAAAALAVTALAIPSAHSATVWNVNIGSEIDTSDNFVGAAPENTVNSTWNSVGNTNLLPLVDSTGAAGTVTVQLGVVGGTLGFTGNGGYLPEIFTTWSKHTSNTLPVAVTFGGLSPTGTYDLIVYADWYWQGGDGVPITQTTGTGMSGTVTLNNFADAVGTVHALTQDTDPTNNGSVKGNWIRINGLTPDGSGNLGFDMNGNNAPISGFQLINTVPEPSAALLGGLGLLALLRRRR
ncbi:MAG: PEP-CTERM sorting domain-containing protein [Akkermansiaceae bacterium]|nr:PEP-CTERM sorting domain-containing protein [Akkermansiaceae bacterium]MCF7731040.1 PEP-CTERM sorting domain-containing protein [Akkermansiaceae bacterium]